MSDVTICDVCKKPIGKSVIRRRIEDPSEKYMYLIPTVKDVCNDCWNRLEKWAEENNE